MGAIWTVSANHLALAGHFPGRPIAPGVVVLALVLEDWRRRSGAPARGFRKAKLVRPLAPDEGFSVEWSEASFRAKVGDELLATGRLELGDQAHGA